MSTQVGIHATPLAREQGVMDLPLAGMTPERTACASIAELLRQDALLQAVPRIEQHEQIDPARLLHLHAPHRPRLEMVGHRAHRTLVRLQHIEADLGRAINGKGVDGSRPSEGFAV